MPAATTRNPPKRCPVCSVAIWAKWDNVETSPWTRYKTHMDADHPAFEKWNRRMRATYWIAVAPFLGLFFLATISASATTASVLAIAAFPALLATICVVWLFQHKGTMKFRNSWKQEHGLPTIRQ